jgi:hypothetical protein
VVWKPLATSGVSLVDSVELESRWAQNAPSHPRFPSGQSVAVTLPEASASIKAATVRLPTRLVPHSVVQDRAQGLVRSAALREFQRVYRARRLAAGGRLFPRYAAALGQLQATLASWWRTASPSI